MPRLFVAIDTPPDISDALRGLATTELDARWTPTEQYHLTLRFLGNVEEPLVDRLASDLQTINGEPFRLELAGLDVFPSLRRPRVLVARVEPAPPLLDLQREIDEIVQGFGIESDKRRFNPHVTLARFRNVRHQEVRSYVVSNAEFRVGSFGVEQFHLYRSDLSPKGAKHTVLASFPLQRSR